jgi:tetratricopeptide (TPR) repeat protein
VELVLDEEASVELWSDRRVPSLVFRPALEKRRTVCLIVDASASMDVWGEVATSWRRTLANSSAFRTVRYFQLDADGEWPVVEPWSAHFGGPGRRGEAARDPRVAKVKLPLGPEGLVFVLTDACSRAWWNGAAFLLALEWSRKVPLGLVSPLPETMWHRTALGQCESMPLFRPAGDAPIYTLPLPTAPNPADAFASSWADDPGAETDDLDRAISGIIPVASTDVLSFGDLVLLLGENRRAARGGGVLIERASFATSQVVTEAMAATPQERVRRFLASASPTATRLAQLLAHFRIPSREAMRLIRAASGLPSSSVHEAEVVLGGLMRLMVSYGRGRSRIRYQFHDGVPPLLREGLDYEDPEAERFLRRFRDYLSRRSDELAGLAAGIPLQAGDSVLRASEDHFLDLDEEALPYVAGDIERVRLALRVVRDAELEPRMRDIGGTPAKVSQSESSIPGGPIGSAQGQAESPHSSRIPSEASHVHNVSDRRLRRSRPFGRRCYLSAVSAQFHDCKLDVNSVLRAIDIEVRSSLDDFRLGSGTTLEKIERNIADCDSVIALVGDAFGAEPPEPARLSSRPRRSYSHWEYYFALGERLDGSTAPPKHVFVYFADDAYLAEHPVEQGYVLKTMQDRFRDAIRESGRDFRSFRSLEDLRLQVLQDAFPRPKRPINLPYSSLGTLFKGRDAFLDSIWARFVGAGRAIVPAQVIHGLGGVGKTRAAVEYAWKFADDYEALLFASVPSVPDLRARLADLAGVLDIPAPAATVDARFEQVLDWLDRHPGWLLIFNNVDLPEAADEIQRLLARLTAGHVLITSRIANWRAGVARLVLDILSQGDSVAFLLERTPQRRRTPDDSQAAAALARELGGLALALEQAGAYIDKRRLSLAEYFRLWESHRDEVLSWFDERLTDYPSSVAVTWDATVAQLREPERALLRVLAYLAPEPIPLALFETDVLAALLPEPRAALAELAYYSLARLTDDGDSVEIHRLVQKLTRLRASQGEAATALQTALSAVAALAPREPRDVRTWNIWGPLAAHAAEVAQLGDAAGGIDPTAHLFHQFGAYCETRGQFADAETMYRRALALDERNHGPNHPDVALDLDALAGLLRATNRWDEAEPMLRRALEIDDQVYGPEHRRTADRLSSLAALLRAKGGHAEAEPLVRHALALNERALGLDHPSVARVIENLAGLLVETGRHSEAESLYRRALAINERAYGPEHPWVARDSGNLAELLNSTGHWSEAEPLYRRALAIDERAYGPDHPEVATDLNNLAGLLLATNRLSEAEPMYRRALAIHERVYGPNSLNVARSLNNLAHLLHEMSRLEEAESMYRRAVTILEAHLGPDHPNVATVVNGLALLLRVTNRHSEAESMYRQALDIDERSLGPDDPAVARDLNNLAELRRGLGHLAEAESMLRRALDINERVYGPEHPEMATNLSNLGEVLHAQEHLVEAEPLLRRALAIDEGVFGPDHPQVAKRLSNLAALLRAMNRLSEAEPMFRRALGIDERAYGPDHPEVAPRLNNLAELLRATNRLREAEIMHRRALAINERAYGADQPELARNLNNLALLLWSTGRLTEAESLFHRAVAILDQFSKRTGQEHPTYRAVVQNHTACAEERRQSGSR